MLRYAFSSVIKESMKFFTPFSGLVCGTAAPGCVTKGKSQPGAVVPHFLLFECKLFCAPVNKEPVSNKVPR